MSTLRLCALICSLLIALLTMGCSKLSVQDLEKSGAALTEQGALGSLTWSVAQDGTAHLLVKDPAGKIVKSGITGQLVFKGSGEGVAAEQTASLEPLGDEGVLRASGLKLESDLNEVGYALVVSGKPWTGTLHLPKEGTVGLTGAAQGNPTSDAEAQGPHGGTIQIAGEHRYEVVGDATSGDVRVYVLDAELKASPHRPEVIKLAVDADPPEVLVLNLGEEGDHYVGTLRSKRPPRKLTLVVRDAGATRVAVVGWRPGVVIHLDGASHRFYWGKRKWGPRGRALGHYKHGHEGHTREISIKVKPGKTKVKVKGRGKGH